MIEISEWDYKNSFEMLPKAWQKITIWEFPVWLENMERPAHEKTYVTDNAKDLKF